MEQELQCAKSVLLLSLIFVVSPSFGEKENYLKNWDLPCFHTLGRLKLELLLSLITAFSFGLLGCFYYIQMWLYFHKNADTPPMHVSIHLFI